MRDFDHLGVNAGDLAAIPDQQALLGEAIDRAVSPRREFCHGRHPPDELARRVDLGQMRNEGGARQRKPRLGVLRQLSLATASAKASLTVVPITPFTRPSFS